MWLVRVLLFTTIEIIGQQNYERQLVLKRFARIPFLLRLDFLRFSRSCLVEERGLLFRTAAGNRA